MSERTTSMQTMAETAARARIEQVSSPWALGDYDRFARELVWGFGPELVEACGIGPGQRVLDVAAGTGNVALRAAEAGAKVVASDLTRENLAVGERNARELGLEIEWVQADAQALPFAEGDFDVVTSSVGAIFAPDHQAVADELIRVCRPDGTIGMTNFTPEGNAAGFFGALAPHAPAPPPDGLPPVLWGNEQHIRELFGNRVASLDMTRKTYVERRPGGPRGYCDFVYETFGPLIAIRAGAEDPEALDRDFLEFAMRANQGPTDGPAEMPYEYLLVLATKC
jgi:ubiquinone/menaquinone biosynthesis C-methylase UbiE